MITVSQLRGVVPHQLIRAGGALRAASVRQHDGAKDFRAHLAELVRTGPGADSAVPATDRVMAVAELSFDSAQRYMRSAATALETLAAELAVSQLALTKAVQLADRCGFEHDDDGGVYPLTGDADSLLAAARLSDVARLALGRATAADVACSGVLGDVARAKVPFAPAACTTTLTDAATRSADARAMQGRADRLLRDLQDAAARTARLTLGRAPDAPDILTEVLDAFWYGGMDTLLLLRLAERAGRGDQSARDDVADHVARLRELGFTDLASAMFGPTSV